MPRPSPKLQWCVVRLGDDLNWWVDEISDPLHWDIDGLGILDPRQLGHIMDLCDALRDYGFDPDVMEQAFYPFRIDKEEKDKRVRLKRAKDVSILENDDTLFALPDILDEDKSPYADFLDQATRYRVKLLNDLIDFEQKLTIDELEEEIRERQNTDYFEGRGMHFFQEITAILEYIPEGYELDSDEESTSAKEEDEIEDIPDYEGDDDEKIEEDETMRWDDEDEDEAGEDEEVAEEDEDKL